MIEGYYNFFEEYYNFLSPWINENKDIKEYSLSLILHEDYKENPKLLKLIREMELNKLYLN